jgi:3alpha(or 20beta)-hydroxysteroid dehydrogenase
METTMTTFNFEGKTALVTGASRGIGLAQATLFAEGGATVVLCDVLEDEGRRAANSLRDRGLDVKFAPLNVASRAEWERTVESLTAETGRLDILVNNAGVLARKTIATYSEEDWRRVLDINLSGTFFGIQAAGAQMRAQRSGAIVNIASTYAYSAHPDPAYTASKWAVRGLTRAAAMELAPFNVRVNCVSPGLVVTDINRGEPHLNHYMNLMPLHRAVETHEVASVVAFFASDLSAMTTGEEVAIDGGFSSVGAAWKVAIDGGQYPHPAHPA